MGDMTTRGPSQGPGFEDLWALFRETDRQMRENAIQMKETERTLKAMGEETDRRMKETDRQMKETDRKIGALGSRLGEVIEHLMSPKLHKKFEALGYCFNHSSRNHELQDHAKNPLTEIDVLLENGDYALAVEVKTRLTVGDVKAHVERMGILRRVADEHGDRRTYLGAVAGAVIDRRVAAYALKQGFYVIHPSGETVDIEVPEGFVPRMWQGPGPRV
jgi:hypothetical protein